MASYYSSALKHCSLWKEIWSGLIIKYKDNFYRLVKYNRPHSAHIQQDFSGESSITLWWIEEVKPSSLLSPVWEATTAGILSLVGIHMTTMDFVSKYISDKCKREQVVTGITKVEVVYMCRWPRVCVWIAHLSNLHRVSSVFWMSASCFHQTPPAHPELPSQGCKARVCPCSERNTHGKCA